MREEIELGATVRVKATGAIGEIIGTSEFNELSYHVQVGNDRHWLKPDEVTRASVFEAMARDERTLQAVLDAGDMSHPRWQEAREWNDRRLGDDDD